jgi:hypothetical protein
VNIFPQVRHDWLSRAIAGDVLTARRLPPTPEFQLKKTT